ncbi:MAG: hypothetical protein RhofKO_37610 [Rhodothermales bacterium]
MTNLLNDLSSLDRALPYRIHRTARLLRHHLRQRLVEVGDGISPEQWFLLFRLYEKDGRAQNELTIPALDDRPNITRLMRSMEAAGYVYRETDPGDRRRSLVYLTDAGRALAEQILSHVVPMRQDLFQGVASSDLEALSRVLDALDARLM